MTSYKEILFPPRELTSLSSAHLDDYVIINLCRLYESHIPENIELANYILNQLNIDIDDLLHHSIHIGLKNGSLRLKEGRGSGKI